MKKVNFSKKAIAAILSLSLMSSAIAAGVPVIDPANLAQAVAQVKNQVQQIENMRAQLKAMTDNGKYADIINNPAIRKQLNQYLPKNYSDVITAAQRGDLGALQQVANAAAQREKQAQTSQTGVQRIAANRLLTEASMDGMMKTLDARSNNIQNLINRINTTQNPAQKADLANALSAQQAQIGIDMNRMQIMMKQAENQEKLAHRQAAREYFKRTNK